MWQIPHDLTGRHCRKTVTTLEHANQPREQLKDMTIVTFEEQFGAKATQPLQEIGGYNLLAQDNVHQTIHKFPATIADFTHHVSVRPMQLNPKLMVLQEIITASLLKRVQLRRLHV